MTSLVHTVIYEATSRIDTTTIVYYVVKFLSNTVTLQGYNTTDGKLFKAGKVSVKAVFLISIKSKKSWYWEPQNYEHIAIVSTLTIDGVHPKMSIFLSFSGIQ